MSTLPGDVKAENDNELGALFFKGPFSTAVSKGSEFRALRFSGFEGFNPRGRVC